MENTIFGRKVRKMKNIMSPQKYARFDIGYRARSQVNPRPMEIGRAIFPLHRVFTKAAVHAHTHKQQQNWRSRSRELFPVLDADLTWIYRRCDADLSLSISLSLSLSRMHFLVSPAATRNLLTNDWRASRVRAPRPTGVPIYICIDTSTANFRSAGI